MFSRFNTATLSPLNAGVRFHMDRRTIFIAALSVSLVNSVESKCIHRPEIRASVRIDACVAATFGATEAKYAFFGAPEPRYRPGETLTGTLLTVSVKTAKFTWAEAMGHSVNGIHLWLKGETQSLFVRDAPANACPEVLPTDAVVQTQRVCCDTVPGGWECLLPRTMSLVTLVKPTATK
jgi:hypothetical protein